MALFRKYKIGEPIDAQLTLTPAIITKVCRVVALGNFRYVAFGNLGIHRNTWRRWLDEGKKQVASYDPERGLPPQGRLLIELEKAEANAHEDIIKNVLTKGSPETQLKFLRMRYNKLYTRNPNATVDDESGAENKRTAEDIIRDKLIQFMEIED
jgi:hypothetical protein